MIFACLNHTHPISIRHENILNEIKLREYTFKYPNNRMRVLKLSIIMHLQIGFNGAITIIYCLNGFRG